MISDINNDLKQRLDDFSYTLPKELIAQEPSLSRDASRMMVLDRSQGKIGNSFFHLLVDSLKKGDCIVVNDSKVIPARLFGKKNTGGVVEILILKQKGAGKFGESWVVLLRPAKRMAPGSKIYFGDGAQAIVKERISDKEWVVEFHTEMGFETFLDKFGRTPTPPYIRRKKGSESPSDRERYQTVYACVPGSVAAPTAGLHFTEEFLDRLSDLGVTSAKVTLHVGYGTFSPVEAPYISDHVMEEEFFEIGEEAAERINSAERVIAVGTTSTRVLETAADETGRVKPATGETGLYIYPGYRFKRVNGLLTNFHLPKSSLFILVCAFAGTEFAKKAYAEAVAERYRFYSYGDCMLIL
jgi:S-adenosylmethionine:tRNA ribosyltransferase-isomerase